MHLKAMATRGLWWLVVLGLLAAIPVAYERYQTESGSARKVEFVFDYRDLLEISDTQTDPQQFVREQLREMKEHGIRSMAVYESTLNEFKLSRRIEVFTSREVVALTQSPAVPGENFTYILFSDREAQERLTPLIRQSFGELNVQVRPWSYKSQSGLVIEMSSDEALLKMMDPDPITLQLLREQGYQIVIRMSNRRTYDPQRMDALLGQFREYGVKRFIVDGDSVPGFVSDEDKANLQSMGDLMNKHGIGLAAIELQKTPQRGFSTLAKFVRHNVVRLHSFTENDAQKLTENITAEELKGRIQVVADRFVLGVKDRNIRMVFINARAVKSLEKGKILHPIDSLYAALDGPDGALPRIQQAGYVPGPAGPFTLVHSGWQPAAKLLLWAGAVALIALTIAYFIPQLGLPVFVIGMLGSAALYVLSPSIFAQGLALGAGTCAPTLAIMNAIRTARKQYGQSEGPAARILFALGLLLRTTLISAAGLLFIVGLLNQITYSLVLEQFRGVSILHLAPIVLVALYWLLFSEKLSYSGRVKRVRELLSAHISVLWIIVAAALLGAGYYYLSRTGNEGQASALERYFRSFLENTLGVRPRNKEFAIAHPLFLLGAYLSFKYRSALLLILAAVVGQASVVDTFAHLHTPLVISSIRVLYGLMFGTLIGLALIAIWEIVIRSWQRWVPRLNE